MSLADTTPMLWDGGPLGALDVCVLTSAGLAALVAGLRQARTARAGLRGAWLGLAAAAVCEVASRYLIWMRIGLVDQHRLPLAGLLLHVIGAGLAAAAVMQMRARTPDRSAARRTLLDTVTITVAVSLVTGNALFGAAADRHGPAGLTAAVVAADVLLAVLALVALSSARYPGGLDLRALLAVGAGLAATAAGDAGMNGVTLGGVARPGSPVDLLVVGGLLLLAAGGLVSSGSDDANAMPHRERIAVCAAVCPVVVAALAVAGYQITVGRLPVSVAVGVVTLSLLLLIRLIVALLDNLVLSRTLESQVEERTLELLTREQWFKSLVQHSSDVVSVIDANGMIRYLSPAAEHMFGHEPTRMIGTSFAALLDPADVGRLTSTLAHAIAQPGRSFVLEMPVEHADGSRRDTETVVTNLFDVPDVRGLVLNTRDVTERKSLQERLTHQAYYDALTGLANRVLFQHELASALPAAPGGVAVLFCDLDGFKAVNDSRGHDVGDALLGVVAQRLRNCVRSEDLVARFGGDEFAVLVRENDALAAARDVAERMAQSLESPVVLDGRELRVGVSIGIAAVAEDACSADVLLRNADLAMYRAKADRQAAVVVFESGMHDALLEQLEVEDDLRAALGSGQLVLHYQPTVCLETGVTMGVEALMRWYRPGQGVVGPQEFIGIAEENGLIDSMGQWALFEACRQGAQWQDYAEPGRTFSIGVNISARQVTPALLDIVAAALAESSLPPSALLLEMTESVLLGRTEEAIQVLRALKRLGVRIAIDDFGTGFSSLSYLARFPVDVLKIDKGFIDAVDGEGERAELARTIVGLGRSLRVITIAEGIERDSQCQALREMGCDVGQGYLFSRPLPAAGVSDILRDAAVGGLPQQRTDEMVRVAVASA